MGPLSAQLFSTCHWSHIILWDVFPVCLGSLSVLQIAVCIVSLFPFLYPFFLFFWLFTWMMNFCSKATFSTNISRMTDWTNCSTLLLITMNVDEESLMFYNNLYFDSNLQVATSTCWLSSSVFFSIILSHYEHHCPETYTFIHKIQ